MTNPPSPKPPSSPRLPRLALAIGLLLLGACTPNLPPLPRLAPPSQVHSTSPQSQSPSPVAQPTAKIPRGVLLDKVVAVVNGSPILLSQVRREERLLLAEIKTRGYQTPSPRAFRRQVLVRLIRERIELEEAQRHGIEASPSQVSAILASIAQRNHVAFSQFPVWLERQGISYIAYRRQIAHALILHRLLEAAVGPTISVSKHEIQAYLRRHGLHGTFEYDLAEIVLPISGDTPQALARTRKEAVTIEHALHHGISFSAMAVAHSVAHNALSGGHMGWLSLRDLPRPARPIVRALHKNQISAPVTTSVGVVIYKLLDTRRQSLPRVYATEYDLERILMVPSPLHGLRATLATLRSIRTKIEHGAHWSVMAHRYSVDPEAAMDGGHLGWVLASNLGPSYRRILLHLPVGRVSAPFPTRDGWAIIRILGKRRRNVTHQRLMQEAYERILTRKFDAASRAYENRLFDESIVHYLVPWAH